MSAAATTAAAAAAAAARRRLEEEEMTAYRRDELDDGWEFKILRSATNAFRDARELRRVLDEEARAGWVLVEKFDDARLRLKRPADAHRADATLDFDPYRTYIGISANRYSLLVAAAVLLGTVGVLLVVALVVR